MDVHRAIERLAAAGCVASELEAAELLRASGCGRVPEGWVQRRERGEPLAWIVGSTTFCGRSVRVDPGVYVPRPQTEELARRAAALLPPRGRAIDLCTGSGAVAAHVRAAHPAATVVGTDVDESAARCASRNRVPVVVTDLADAVHADATFDAVTAVPPYVPSAEVRFLPADVRDHEPLAALDGGPDGLDLAGRVVAEAGRLLRAGGWLLIELGADQDELLRPALLDAGFGAVECWFDDDGDLRGLAAPLHRG